MDGPNRWDRAAAATLTVVGLVLVTAATVLFVRYLPDILGARGEHLAGDTTLFVMFVLVPIAVGGSIALLSARLLWRGRPGGRLLGWIWVALAGMACVVTYAATGNSLSFVRMALVDGGAWSLSWPELSIAKLDAGTYASRVDEITFWLPALVAVVALALACFLVAGTVTSGRRNRGTA